MFKQKVINDPVHGFIAIHDELIYAIIEHPYFQRLRRIKQLGLTDFVYPGAHHTRFHHALGAYHLMRKALMTLKNKGVEISPEEEQGAQIAILLHDIGHGPFSHTLEHTLMRDISHEEISLLFMESLNAEFQGQLDLAIKIFKNEHPKKFLHQLVSGQLDVDRLDYLTRDSFFTGVSEGVINYNRLIDMMDVVDNALVLESKAIYSIEKFLISRRIMYWQVYLHKTVVCAEEMLIKLILRAKYLVAQGQKLPCSKALAEFLYKDQADNLRSDKKLLVKYANLDDIDILSAVKSWQYEEDKILSFLARSLQERKLFKIKLQEDSFDSKKIETVKHQIMKRFELNESDTDFLIINKSITTYLYNPKQVEIKILGKNGKLQDFDKASDQWSSLAMQKAVTKHYCCYPKSAS
ncbi:HD domain-containing protein [Chitinophagales bacterium]|nr:HD domain-containing protein [Chitinophagales bacterium]